MDINIRKANELDKPKLLKWGRELWQVEKQFEPLLKYSKKDSDEKYTSELKSPESLLLVVEMVNEPVGYLYAYLKNFSEYLRSDEQSCELEVVYIEKKARGKGLAEKLIDECIEWAKNNNAKCVKAGVYAKNKISFRPLNKKGFEDYHTTLQLSLK